MSLFTTLKGDSDAKTKLPLKCRSCHDNSNGTSLRALAKRYWHHKTLSVLQRLVLAFTFTIEWWTMMTKKNSHKLVRFELCPN